MNVYTYVDPIHDIRTVFDELSPNEDIRFIYDRVDSRITTAVDQLTYSNNSKGQTLRVCFMGALSPQEIILLDSIIKSASSPHRQWVAEDEKYLSPFTNEWV